MDAQTNKAQRNKNSQNHINISNELIAINVNDTTGTTEIYTPKSCAYLVICFLSVSSIFFSHFISETTSPFTSQIYN